MKPNHPFNPVLPLCDLIARYKGVGKYARLILLQMSFYADPDGTNIYLSLKELHELTELSPRAIAHHLDCLVAREFLIEDGYHGHTKRYKINVKKFWPDYMPWPKFARKVQLVPAPLPQVEVLDHDDRRVDDSPDERLQRRIRAYKRQIAMQYHVTPGGDAWEQAEYAKHELAKLGIDWRVEPYERT